METTKNKWHKSNFMHQSIKKEKKVFFFSYDKQKIQNFRKSKRVENVLKEARQLKKKFV